MQRKAFSARRSNIARDTWCERKNEKKDRRRWKSRENISWHLFLGYEIYVIRYNTRASASKIGGNISHVWDFLSLSITFFLLRIWMKSFSVFHIFTSVSLSHRKCYLIWRLRPIIAQSTRWLICRSLNLFLLSRLDLLSSEIFGKQLKFQIERLQIFLNLSFWSFLKLFSSNFLQLSTTFLNKLFPSTFHIFSSHENSSLIQFFISQTSLCNSISFQLFCLFDLIAFSIIFTVT